MVDVYLLCNMLDQGLMSSFLDSTDSVTELLFVYYKKYSTVAAIIIEIKAPVPGHSFPDNYGFHTNLSIWKP